MNHICLIRLVVLKRPGFQSRKYGMPTVGEITGFLVGERVEFHWTTLIQDTLDIIGAGYEYDFAWLSTSETGYLYSERIQNRSTT